MRAAYDLIWGDLAPDWDTRASCLSGSTHLGMSVYQSIIFFGEETQPIGDL